MQDSTPANISVCLCVYSPRREYLERVLTSLRAQTLNPASWELIVIDNNNPEPLQSWLDLSGLPSARIVMEKRQGLTFARWRAIEEARNDLIVFVDDDNVLKSDFLENAIGCMKGRPFLGVAGGRIEGVFERPPSRWVRCFYPYLAIADFRNHACWGNDAHVYQQWYPRGSGMVLRRAIAEDYRRQYASDAFRQNLGRHGDHLAGSEDTDLVFHAMDQGCAVGFFPELRVEHLIPPERTTYRYMRELIYRTHYSSQQLFIKREVRGRPRTFLLSFLGNIGLCILSGYFHPVAWWLALQVARGKHDAWNDMERQWREQKTSEPAPAGRMNAISVKEPRIVRKTVL